MSVLTGVPPFCRVQRKTTRRSHSDKPGEAMVRSLTSETNLGVGVPNHFCLFFRGHLCLFLGGRWCLFFWGRLCLFVVRKQQSRAKALFGQPWAVGLGLLLALGFLSLGFRFGLTLFRASAWVSSFLGFRLSFKLAFASFRVLGWVYSVFIMGFLSLGFGLALLLLGLRPGFDRF